MSLRCTVLTYEGLNLLAKCQTGKILHFARVVAGDGVVSDNQNLRQLTGLVNPKLEMPIRSIKVTGVGTSIIETELKNTSLTAGFFAREIGVFAVDPDDGNEILYAIRNTGNDSEYIPAGGGSEIWHIFYDIVTVVDQATNITATINGDIAYATKLELDEHINSENPHPNLLQTGKEVEGFTHLNCDFGSNKKLNWISLDNARKAILGGEASTIPIMQSRINQLEIEQANIALQQEAEGNCPDSNLLLAEDFVNPDKIDTFAVKVKSIVAGDNGIDVETLSGIIPGAWYTVSDGVNQEYIQIKSCIKNGSVYRVLANNDINYTYNIDHTMIYRSTAQIDRGVVYGSGDKKGFNWRPSQVWQGVNANVATTLSLETTQDKADEFVCQDNLVFTADGLVSLEVE